jgi:hypothetical protein
MCVRERETSLAFSAIITNTKHQSKHTKHAQEIQKRREKEEQEEGGGGSVSHHAKTSHKRESSSTFAK